MKKRVTTLLTAATAIAINAALPNQSSGQIDFYVAESGAWSLGYKVPHTRAELPDGSTKYTRSDLYGHAGGRTETTTYDQQGNKIEETLNATGRWGRVDNSKTFTYSSENQLLNIIGKTAQYGRGTRPYKAEFTTTVVYGNSGLKEQEITIKQQTNIPYPKKKTTMVTYQYNQKDQIIHKVTKNADGSKNGTSYTYAKAATGETIITENSHQNFDDLYFYRSDEIFIITINIMFIRFW